MCFYHSSLNIDRLFRTTNLLEEISEHFIADLTLGDVLNDVNFYTELKNVRVYSERVETAALAPEQHKVIKFVAEDYITHDETVIVFENVMPTRASSIWNPKLTYKPQAKPTSINGIMKGSHVIRKHSNSTLPEWRKRYHYRNTRKSDICSQFVAETNKKFTIEESSRWLNDRRKKEITKRVMFAKAFDNHKRNLLVCWPRMPYMISHGISSGKQKRKRKRANDEDDEENQQKKPKKK